MKNWGRPLKCMRAGTLNKQSSLLGLNSLNTWKPSAFFIKCSHLFHLFLFSLHTCCNPLGRHGWLAEATSRLTCNRTGIKVQSSKSGVQRLQLCIIWKTISLQHLGDIRYLRGWKFSHWHSIDIRDADMTVRTKVSLI